MVPIPIWDNDRILYMAQYFRVHLVLSKASTHAVLGLAQPETAKPSLLSEVWIASVLGPWGTKDLGSKRRPWQSSG